MDVAFDRYCEITVLADHGKEFKARIINDFSFLATATKDTDMMLDAAVADAEDGQRQINIKEFVNMLSAKPQSFQGQIEVCTP